MYIRSFYRTNWCDRKMFTTMIANIWGFKYIIVYTIISK